MEGVIFSLKEMTEVIGDLGVEPKEIRMSGGGANSALWRQIHADVFEREVRIMNGAAEGGAFGAALLAGAGSGVWKSTEDAVRVLRTESHTKPNETNVKRYRELYTIYKQLYLSIRPIFEQLAGLADR